MKKTAKPIGRIEDETILMPWIIADKVVQELELYLYKNYGIEFSTYINLSDYLVNYAQKIYENRPDIRKKMRHNETWGRDWLYCFMRHWLSGKLLSQYGSKIPASFKNGEEIQ